MQYEAGDKIILRKDLETGKLYDNFFWTHDMQKMAGRRKYSATITKIRGSKGYCVDIFGVTITVTDAMIERRQVEIRSDTPEILKILEV